MTEQPKIHRARAAIVCAVTQWPFILFLLLAAGPVVKQLLADESVWRRHWFYAIACVGIAMCVHFVFWGLGLAAMAEDTLGRLTNVYLKAWLFVWCVLSWLLWIRGQ